MSNSEYIRPLIKEHELIADCLETEFFEYLDELPDNKFSNDKEKEFLKRFIRAISKSFEKSQSYISDSMGFAEHSVISTQTSRLNSFLEEFSNNRVDPPIGLFSHHLNSGKKSKTTRCHLACAEKRNISTVMGADRIHSWRIVLFEEAKVGGKRKSAENETGSSLKQFRTELKTQAEEQLKKKLQGKERDDYRLLELEIGLLEQSRVMEESLRPSPEDHNRRWQDFSPKELEKPQGVYILSSETGSGKTTFLRNLQLQIIENTELVPIFLDASTAATLDYRNGNTSNFLKGVAELFNGYLESKNEYDFLQRYLDKIVFLIDGLDQIEGTGSEYKNLIDDLTSVIKDKLIITSRPFASIYEEEDSKIKFLRLKPFSEKETKGYFGGKYNRSKELCKTCPEMIHVPMLAYMIRQLIEEGKDKWIRNRTDLYKEFINYVFKGYPHSNLRKLSEEKKAKIRKAYGEISFKAIANDVPYLQKIPFSFAIDCKETAIEIDDLFKYGIAHIIVNRSQRANEYVYFSHQSFQEYLAAEHIARSDDMIGQVLREKWNPKWEGVIKFLVGIKGQEIIERILLEKDNPIHSKLFLSVKLVPETDVSPKLRSEILRKTESLLEHPLFNSEVKELLLYIDETKAIHRLMVQLKYTNSEDRSSAIYALGKLKDRIDDNVVGELIYWLVKIGGDKHEDPGGRSSAISTLGKLKDRIDDKVFGRLINWLVNIVGDKDENDSVRGSAIRALEKLKDRIDDKVVGELIFWLVKIAGDKDEDQWGRSSAMYTLVKLRDRIDDRVFGKLINRLVNIVGDSYDNKWGRSSAISTLVKLKDRIDGKVFGKLIFWLVEIVRDKHEDELVRRRTMSALVILRDRIDDKVSEELINRLVKIIEDEENEPVYVEAISTFWALAYTIDGKLVGDIVKERIIRLVKTVGDKDEGDWGRGLAINAFVKLRDRIDSKVFGEFINRLVEIAGDKDEGNWVRRETMHALGKLRDKIDDKVIVELVGKLITLQDIYARMLLEMLYKEGELEFLGQPKH